MNINYKIVAALVIYLSVGGVFAKEATQENMQVQVGARESKKVSLALVQIKKDALLDNICLLVMKDLNFTDHFETTLLSMEKMPDKKEIKKLEESGYSLAVFITNNHKKNSFDVRIYDVKKGKMVTDKGYLIHQKGKIERAWAHEISNLLLQKLLNSEPLFCSKIAYCKQNSANSRQLCIVDYDGSHEQVVARAKLLIAPCWNVNDDHPALLYSRYTSSNVRLMELDVLTGKEKAVISFEGLNMLPAFSPISDEMVVCLSCKGGTQLFSSEYDRRKKGMNYTQLTFNNGNNISPTILEDNSIIFCSDFQGGKPQLYKLDRDKDVLSCLSESADICFSPVYSPVCKRVAYTKMVDGVGQLFLYNVKNGKHTQLTFDDGHKQEPSWSPCGNYLAFGFSNDTTKRIAIQSLLTGTRHFITSEDVVCTYPSWSMNFSVFPLVK